MDSQCAGSPIARARKNLAALEALAAAEERGSATAAEIAAMEAYSGWGGAQKAFSEKAEGEWGEIRDRLRELLSEDEFASQRHTVLTAFYTPAPVIGAIYDALREAGIGRGNKPAAILEPGCGTGNFMRLAPADLALDFHGVELDPISARIAQALCPEAHITAAGLEECRVSPASFDAAIGNVPYSGDIKIDGMPIHDYFIRKSVEAVRPGGIVAVLTSRYTLDKNSTATRRAMAEQTELLGAVRLPAETFRRQAGTEALSDILLLRRRPEPIALSDDELPEWVETSPFEDTVNINRYFNEHPSRAVGDMSVVSGPMGPTLGVSFKGAATALGDRVSDLLRDSVDRAGVVEMAAAEEAAGVSVVPTAPTKFEFSVAADGTIWYGTEDAVEPFTPGGGKTGPERARAMLLLRDGARALLALERDPGADDDEVEEAIAGLSAEYDSFLERYGRINSKKNLAVFPSKGFTDHSLALNLLSLEKVDSNGEVTGKADILKKRLVTPEAPTPKHVGNPSDALAVTIDVRGGVDMDFLADLMETDVRTALERLGDLVVTDPDDATHVMTADEYLSGDVGGKLEHVRALLDAERGRAERQTRQAWNEHLGFSVDADGLPVDVRDALAQLRKTHLWESSLNPTTSRFAVDGFAHSEGLDHGARRINWDCWPALIPLALEAYDGPRPIAVQDGDDRASVSTGNPLIDLLARGLGDFYSGQIDKDVAKTPAHAIKYLVCDSGLSDEELGAFFAAGGSGILNRSEYFETFRAVAGVEIEPPVRSSYGEVSVREARIENAMRLARALRAAPDAVEYLYRIERKQRSEDRVTKADLLRRDGRPSYLVDYYSGEPAKLSDLATEEGLERFCEHKARFMEAAKLAVPPVDPDRVAALERLESRLEAVQPVKLVPGQIACQLGSSWVPASAIRDFALETFKIGYGHESRVRGSYQTAAQARGLEVRYSEVSGRWGVTSASGGMDESVAKKWGVGSYNCFMILTAALNGGLIQIEKDNPDYNPVAEKSKKKIPDPVATAAANAKRRELEEAFREWVWKDESHAVAVPATPEQLAEVEALVKRGEKVHAGCDPSVDNMLKITGDGRKVALDPKLLYLEDDPDMEPLSGGKVDACVQNILDIRERTEAERGAQLVFVDSSTPASGRWNIQDDVRRRLIEAGVPESEIACVTDAKGKSKQKEALYEKVRDGEIRILLGSTTTLGTGTNVQTRLAAIHDLDCPWRPSDLEQRLGRIVRQGNGFDRVHDFRYVSTGTFDSYLYSIVERKQRFISQVFTNKSPVRTMDDLDETVLSLAQMKQIAEGDPTVAERMDVENKIGQLKLMRESHLEGLADVQHKIETQYRPLVDALAAERDMLADDQIPFSEADLVRQQTLGSKDSFLTVGGTHIADREEAIRALRRAAYDVRPGCQETIGTYRGLSVVCRRQHVLDDDWLPYIGLAVDPAKHVHMSERVFPSGEKGAFTVLTQMDRIIAKDAKGPAEIELKLGTAQRALADAQKAAKEPFPKQAELDELEQRLAVLEYERIEAELQCQREQAQRDEAEAAAIEVGVEEERETEREHERAAAADDEAREAARMAELRRQGLICEDSAAHNAATAVPNGVALGVPDDIAEAARCSAAASARDGRAEGEKRKAGM